MTVLNDIVSGSFDEYDRLPYSAKILLAARLLNSMGTDLSTMRDRLFHDVGDRVELPRLRQEYGAVSGGPLGPVTQSFPTSRPTSGPRHD